MFVVAQLVGAALGAALIVAALPRRRRQPPTTSSSRTDAREPAHARRNGHSMTTPTRKSCSCASTTPAAPRWPPRWLHHLAGGAVDVRSAGSEPADADQPGRPSTRWPRSASTSRPRHPKLLTTDAVEASDVVITMGCGDACPIFPGKRYEDWELTTPPARASTTVRPIRDEIDGSSPGPAPGTGTRIRLNHDTWAGRLKSTSSPARRE